jgi:hypothetical protein
VSFFDEGDEPPTRTQRAARPSGGGARTGGIAADPQTVRNRRIIAVVFVVLFIVLLSVLVNSCLDTRAENRLKDYNRDVGSVIGRSDREVGRPFFDLISQGGAAPNELEQSISSLRNRADDHVQEAEGFDVPDELKTAQRNLLLALDMRAAGLEKIAGQVRTALVQDGGEEAEAATAQIAAQMQQFLSSDVIYDARVTPYIQQTLVDKDIAGQTVPGSQFLPSLEWLDVEVVADRLGAEAGDAGGGGNAPARPRPGERPRRRPGARAGRDREPHPGRLGHRLRRRVRQPGREPGAERPRARAHPRAGDQDDQRRAARRADPAGRERDRVRAAAAGAADRHSRDDRGLGREGPWRGEGRQQPPDLHGDLHSLASSSSWTS